MEQYNISEAKAEIKRGIVAYLSKNQQGGYLYPVVNRIPFYLEGPPGIGKTEVVEQIAEELGIGFVSFSLTHHTRNSLLGLPVICNLEEGDKYTEYTMSEIIACVRCAQEGGMEEGILLLDEFNCASETVMPAMLAMLQSRNIGTHRLPDQWVIVLCGNPPAYNNLARKLSPAIWDRVRRMVIKNDPGDFCRFAVSRSFHPVVRSFLELNGNKIYRVNDQKDSMEVVTNRGWENLSHTLKAYEAMDECIDLRTVGQYLKSDEISFEFYMFYWATVNGVDEEEVEKVLRGEGSEVLKKVLEHDSATMTEEVLLFFEKALLKYMKQDSEKKPSEKELSDMAGNVLKFLKNCNGTDLIAEKFFYFVTENSILLDAVKNYMNEEYIDMAARSYNLGMAAV